MILLHQKCLLYAAINDDRGIEEKLSEKFDEMQKDGTMEIIVSKYLSNAYKYLEVDSLE